MFLARVSLSLLIFLQNNIQRYDNDDDDVRWEIKGMGSKLMMSGESQVQFSVPYLLLLFLCEWSSVMKQ